MRILFIGDVLGRSGREAVAAALPRLRASLRIDLAVVNAENASHGFGLAPDMADALFTAGADVITLGNHAWDRREIIPYIGDHPRLLRALNYPPGTPGGGSVVVDVPGGRRALVAQAMGRLFMDPLDCPFRATADLLARHRLAGTVQAIVLDIHAEATSEKMAYAHSFDGQVSVVVGTHTHCPSADAQVLPGGTAFQSDAGCPGTMTASSACRRTPPRYGFGGRCLGSGLARPRAIPRFAAYLSKPMTQRAAPGGSSPCGRVGAYHRRYRYHEGLGCPAAILALTAQAMPAA